MAKKITAYQQKVLDNIKAMVEAANRATDLGEYDAYVGYIRCADINKEFYLKAIDKKVELERKHNEKLRPECLAIATDRWNKVKEGKAITIDHANSKTIDALIALGHIKYTDPKDTARYGYATVDLI